MWRKLLGILTLFSFLPYFSICQNKLRENGWYHILSGQTDSISREPIVTTKDFIALKLDTDYFGKYVISGQISNYKRKKWAEETGKATGRQIAFIFNDSVITNPRVNCSIESGAFQITSVLDEKLPDIYKQLKQEKIDSIATLFKDWEKDSLYFAMPPEYRDSIIMAIDYWEAYTWIKLTTKPDEHYWYSITDSAEYKKLEEALLSDKGNDDRILQLQQIIADRAARKMEYDDTIVHQMIECVKVYPDGRLDIIFGGGYFIEERLEKES